VCVGIRKEFECSDVLGNKITCSKKRWRHIIEQHPEMRNLQKLVKSIINKPEFVNRSRLYSNSYVYYRQCLLSQLGKSERYIRVVIQYNLDEEELVRGGVMTALACNGPQLGEVEIWRYQTI
jgi:hypothetical protein